MPGSLLPVEIRQVEIKMSSCQARIKMWRKSGDHQSTRKIFICILQSGQHHHHHHLRQLCETCYNISFVRSIPIAPSSANISRQNRTLLQMDMSRVIYRFLWHNQPSSILRISLIPLLSSPEYLTNRAHTTYSPSAVLLGQPI